jgi:hypothetical protein
VHLPEPTLFAGGLGGQGDPRRPGVSALVREVAEDVDEPIAEGLSQSDHHAAKTLAIRAQQIAVPDDLDRGGPRPSAPDVVARLIDRLLVAKPRYGRL